MNFTVVSIISPPGQGRQRDSISAIDADRKQFPRWGVTKRVTLPPMIRNVLPIDPSSEPRRSNHVRSHSACSITSHRGQYFFRLLPPLAHAGRCRHPDVTDRDCWFDQWAIELEVRADAKGKPPRRKRSSPDPVLDAGAVSRVVPVPRKNHGQFLPRSVAPFRLVRKRRPDQCPVEMVN